MNRHELAALVLVVAALMTCTGMYGYLIGLEEMTDLVNQTLSQAQYAKALLSQSITQQERVLGALWGIDYRLVDSIVNGPFPTPRVAP